MPKFRSKPVEIEAWQLTREKIEAHLFGDAGAFPSGLAFRGQVHPTERRFMGHFICSSRQGEVTAEIDDWIIAEPGAEGFLAYPCKPDVFEQKYEPIDG